MKTEEKLVIISCTLSIIGAIATLASYYALPQLKSRPGRRLIAILSAADLVSAVSYVLPTVVGIDVNDSDKDLNRYVCRAQAILDIYWPVASFLWTNCIAVYVASIIYGKTWDQAKMFRTFHAVCWTVPAISVIIVMAFQAEGHDGGKNSGGWCWIRSMPTHKMIVFELIGGKLIDILSCCVITPALYICSARRLVALDAAAKLDGAPTGRRRLSAYNLRLTLVPVVFFFVRMWGSTRVLAGFIDPATKKAAWLKRMQSFFDPSQGFFNGLLFVVCSPETLRAFGEQCGCRRPRRPTTRSPDLAQDQDFTYTSLHDTANSSYGSFTGDYTDDEDSMY